MDGLKRRKIDLRKENFVKWKNWFELTIYIQIIIETGLLSLTFYWKLASRIYEEERMSKRSSKLYIIFWTFTANRKGLILWRNIFIKKRIFIKIYAVSMLFM
jgi:hypothetical protein